MDEKQLINLVAGVEKKDNAAMETLFKAYYADVLFICKKYSLSDADANDIAQETFIKAFKEIGSLSNAVRFPAWLQKIATNKCLDLLRHNKIITMDTLSTDEESLDIIDKNQNVEDAVIDSEIQNILSGMIEKLPIEQRVTVFMYYYQDYSIKEIAAAYGCSENTVKSRLNYAKKAMRKEADKLEDKGVKLRAVAALPFLYMFFAGEREAFACETPDCVSVISQVMGAAANTVSKAGFFSTLAGKITIGAAAFVVVAGGVVSAVAISNNGRNNSHNNSQVIENTTESDLSFNDGGNGSVESDTSENETSNAYSELYSEPFYEHEINYINEEAIDDGEFTFVLREWMDYSSNDCYVGTITYDGKKGIDYMANADEDKFYASRLKDFSYQVQESDEVWLYVQKDEYTHTVSIDMDEKPYCESVEEYAERNNTLTTVFKGYVGEFYVDIWESEGLYSCNAYKFFDDEHIIEVTMNENEDDGEDFNPDFEQVFKDIVESISIEYVEDINSLQGTNKCIVYDRLAKLLSEKYPIYLKDYSNIREFEYNKVYYETEECSYILKPSSAAEINLCTFGEYDLIASLGEGIELYYCTPKEDKYTDGFVVVNNNLGTMVKVEMYTEVEGIEERLDMFRRDLFK